MSRHPATAAPPDSSAAGLPGLYCCTTDRCTYQVLPAPKGQGGGLLLRRRAPGEPNWRPACTTTPDHITRLLAFGSFERIQE